MFKDRLLEKKKKKIQIHKGKSVNFRADEIILSNGKTATREFIEHPGAVAVLAFDNKNRIIFVKQYRYPVKKHTLEIPAGKMHGKKDNPVFRAKEELKEETGWQAKKMIHLLDYWPTPAFSDEILKIYIAKGLSKGRKNPDEDEFVKTEKINFLKSLEMIKKGFIKDSKTIIALYHYGLFLNKENK